ncbi:MAG: thioredoxin [Acidobacteriota bacterium]|jgi:thioredoxin 1
MSKVVHVNDGNFQREVLESERPVMIDFTAAWCGPCKLLAPVVEDLAEAYDGRLKVAKIDVEEAQRTAMQYGVLSVPTLLFLKGGQVADQIVGNAARQKIEEHIARVL